MITPELKYAYIVKKSFAFTCLLSELHMNIHQQIKKQNKTRVFISIYPTDQNLSSISFRLCSQCVLFPKMLIEQVANKAINAVLFLVLQTLC